jgi:hypothetical protein
MATNNLLSLNPKESFHPDAAELSPLLELPARFLSGLPEPIRLRLKVAGAPAPIFFSTCPSSEPVPVLASTISFAGRELEALVCGIEADRLWHPEFLGFCFEKWRRPSFELSFADALSGANPDEHATFSLRRVLTRLEARVEQLEFISAVTVAQRPLHAAA